jgi:hypothetical protein
MAIKLWTFHKLKAAFSTRADSALACHHTQFSLGIASSRGVQPQKSSRLTVVRRCRRWTCRSPPPRPETVPPGRAGCLDHVQQQRPQRGVPHEGSALVQVSVRGGIATATDASLAPAWPPLFAWSSLHPIPTLTRAQPSLPSSDSWRATARSCGTSRAALPPTGSTAARSWSLHWARSLPQPVTCSTSRCSMWT